jgi:hypothetical protein
LLVGTPARADRTKLLEVDLKTGARRNIDGSGAKTRADRQLDAMLDSAAGGASFSTKDLEKIEKALRRFLKSARPRAMPRLLLFLYPGRISRGRLTELREVVVDVDLVVDPCGRNVCRASVAKTIELLGRSIRQAVIRTSRYTIRFKTVTIRTRLDLRGADDEVYQFKADQVVGTGQKSGGGYKLLDGISKAQKGYTQQVTKAVSRLARQRRVPLTGPPNISKKKRSVAVSMALKSDRNRYKSHVLGALIAAAEAVNKNPLTPPQVSYAVVAKIRFRKVERRTYSCMGQPLALYLKGRVSKGEIWSNYVVEKKKGGGTEMTFSDDEATGGVGGADMEEDRTSEILSAHFNLLAPCLQSEAGRNRRFKGVTLKFAVSSAGKATSVKYKERVSGSLGRCLKQALGRIRFQRHGGAPRQVEYPMYIKR